MSECHPWPQRQVFLHTTKMSNLHVTVLAFTARLSFQSWCSLQCLNANLDPNGRSCIMELLSNLHVIILTFMAMLSFKPWCNLQCLNINLNSKGRSCIMEVSNLHVTILAFTAMLSFQTWCNPQCLNINLRLPIQIKGNFFITLKHCVQLCRSPSLLSIHTHTTVA